MKPKTTFSRRSTIYDALDGLSVGEALSLLSKILTEQLNVSSLSVEKVQAHADDINALAAQMELQDFLFLLSSAINAHVYSRIIQETPN